MRRKNWRPHWRVQAEWLTTAASTCVGCLYVMYCRVTQHCANKWLLLYQLTITSVHPVCRGWYTAWLVWKHIMYINKSYLVHHPMSLTTYCSFIVNQVSYAYHLITVWSLRSSATCFQTVWLYVLKQSQYQNKSIIISWSLTCHRNQGIYKSHVQLKLVLACDKTCTRQLSVLMQTDKTRLNRPDNNDFSVQNRTTIYYN